MKPRSLWTVLVSMTVLLIVVGPAFVRTIATAKTADGLTALAMRADGFRCWNPWSQDCFLIGPEAAVGILRAFDWPYENRRNPLGFSQPMPLLHQAVAGRALSDSDVDKRMLELTRIFLARGESPDEYHEGYTVLHAAILFGDLPAVRLLVDAGSNPDARIDIPERASHGMNARQFAEFLTDSPNRPSAGGYQQVMDYLNGPDGGARR